MPQQYDAIVAGAGIIGASIAYHLASRGQSVAVMDRTGPFAGASGAADGAVSICSKKSGILLDLAQRALRYCRELAHSGKPLSGIFHQRPAYYFSTTEQEDVALDVLAARLATLNCGVCVKADRQGRDAQLALAPPVRRVIEVAGEGHMLGYEAVDAFLHAGSVVRHWPCTLTAFETAGDRVRVHTDQGPLETGYLILTAGLGTLGFIPDLPLLPRSGQLIVTDRDPEAPPLPGVLTAAAYLLDKNRGGEQSASPPIVIDPLVTGQLLIGSSRENAGDVRRTDFATVKRLLGHAVRCYPPLASRRVIRVFAGVRAAVSDGLPVVGFPSGMPRVFVATGFEGDGICLSAVIGREVASLLLDGTTAVPLDALSPNRFKAQQVVG